MPPAKPDKGRRRQGAATAAPYELSVSPRALTQVLLIVALTLLAYHVALSVYHYRVHELPWLLRQLFDVDEENNIPTWFSDFLLLTAWFFLWLCARKKRADGDPWFRYWYALTIGFLLMAIDEIAGVHETINSVIVMSWAIPAGIGAIVIGIAFIPFLLHLPRRTALRFVIAGAVYLAGAVGIEIIGNSMAVERLKDTLKYCLSTAVEEGLEMIGVILFIHALLHYMRDSTQRSGHGPVRASLELK